MKNEGFLAYLVVLLVPQEERMWIFISLGGQEEAKKVCFFNKMALALFARHDIPPWRDSKRKRLMMKIWSWARRFSDPRRVGGKRLVNRGQ
jgi:hypothetical protein